MDCDEPGVGALDALGDRAGIVDVLAEDAAGRVGRDRVVGDERMAGLAEPLGKGQRRRLLYASSRRGRTSAAPSWPPRHHHPQGFGEVAAGWQERHKPSRTTTKETRDA
jgi:hypothetical protein